MFLLRDPRDVFHETPHHLPTTHNFGAVILCGGRSLRMGVPKAQLPFGNSTSLQRVIQASQAAAGHVVVVGSQTTDRTSLPSTVQCVVDETPFPGPLAALLQGFQSLPESVDQAFLLSCDLPLISTRFLNRLRELQQEHQIVVVESDRHLQPFAAIYRRSVIPIIQQRLEAGERSLQSLLRAGETLVLPAELFCPVDPLLLSLRNMNSPENYQELLHLFRQQQAEEDQNGGTPPVGSTA